MKVLTLCLSACALTLVALPSLAKIHKKAASASHKLEDAAGDLHTEMHHHFPSSYGSHDMEERAEDVHDVLHDFQNGNATECDVMAARAALVAAWKDLNQQFKANGVLQAGFSEVNQAYKDTKKQYHLEYAFTASGKCAGTSSGTAGGSFSGAGGTL